MLRVGGAATPAELDQCWGGVALVEKAKSYLKSSETNKGSEAVAAMKIELSEMKEAMKKKDRQIDVLMEQLTEPKAKRQKAG